MATIKTYGDAAQLAEFLQSFDSFAKVSRHFYSSPEALAAHCDTVSQASAWTESPWRTGSSNMGTADMSEAVKLCRDGWQDGAETAARLRDRINAANPMGPRVIRYDVAGAFPSVPRALAGNPLNMRRVDSAKLRRRPVMTLVSDMAVNWDMPDHVITRRAAVVAAVVDAIESAGFACQIIATAATRKNNDIAAQVAVEVKDSGAPVDIARMAFALGHGAMFRRLCWVTYVENTFTKGLGNALGTAAPLVATPAMAENSVYVLPSAIAARSKFETDKAAETEGLAFLVESLARQGCPAFPQENRDAA